MPPKFSPLGPGNSPHSAERVPEFPFESLPESAPHSPPCHRRKYPASRNFRLCAGRDSNPRRPKPPRLQRGVIDRSTTDAFCNARTLVCLIFCHGTIAGMRRYHVLALAGSLATLLPTLVLAAGMPGPIVPCSGIKCTCNDLIKVAENVLNTGIYFAVFISAILFAWAGWKMLSGKSMGESGKIEDAKKVLWNVIIGLVGILAAWLIVDTVMRTLTTSSVWSNICPK